MKRIGLFLTLITSAFLIHSCSKELSREGGGGVAQSAGSLQSEASGNCLPKTVNGIYEAGTALNPDAEYIEIQVNVTTAGTYQISTDAVNGISFTSSGSFANLGLNTVRLKGSGTPTSAGTNSFTISYSGTTCKVDVTVLPVGGADPAVFDLKGSPNACDASQLSGAYATGIVLNSPSNNVALKVDVKTPGTYNITTTAVNGIIFSGSGSLPDMGDATIVLTASGTPGAAGAINIPVSTGTSNCSFPLTVTGAAEYTIDCGTAQILGVYTEGVALGASNIIQVSVTSTGSGAYSITATSNGMTFSGSGSFPGATTQTVTLTGSGTPQADGDFSVELTGGTAACSVDVTVDPGTPVSDLKWEFKQGSTTYSGPTNGAMIADILGLEGLSLNGQSTGGGEAFILAIGKMGGLTTGTYSTKALTGNSVTLTNLTTASTMYTANPVNGDVTITITTLDRTNGIVQGTFSGTAKNAGGANVSVSGSFKAEIL